MAYRSQLAEIVFPAPMGGRAAELLALQRQYDASQYWPPERMRQAQRSQLNLLLAQAATIPFHAARLRQAGIDPARPLTEEAWTRLPILTRADIGPHLHAAAPATHGPVGESTSRGITGPPVSVRKTALDNLFWQSAMVRDEAWHRPSPAGLAMRLLAIPEASGNPAGVLLPDAGPPMNQIWPPFPVLLADPALPPSAIAALLDRHRPATLHTEPAILRALLPHLAAPPCLHAVWITGGAVDDALRAASRKTFAAPIIASYTAAETGYMALQCPSHPHFHVLSENCRVEVLDNAGNPVLPGETGRVVVTPLHNFAMPLLRYDIGDEATCGPPCPCGRRLPVLTRIARRLPVLPSAPFGPT